MATPLSDEIRALIAYANETTEADDTKLGDCVKTLVDGYNGGSNVPSSPLVIPTGALSSRLASLLAYANETTGAGDTLVGDAIRTLCEGYGQGGELVFYEKLITDGEAVCTTDIEAAYERYDGATFIYDFDWIQSTYNASVMGAVFYGNRNVNLGVSVNNRLTYSYFSQQTGAYRSDTMAYTSLTSGTRYKAIIAPVLEDIKLYENGAPYCYGASMPPEMTSRQSCPLSLLGHTNRFGTPTPAPANSATYGFRVEKNGEVLHNLVPCTYNGEPGMWDLVEQKFYGNANTSGAFSVEGEIMYYDKLVGDGVAYIDTDIPYDPTTRVRVDFDNSANKSWYTIIGVNETWGRQTYFSVTSNLYYYVLARIATQGDHNAAQVFDDTRFTAGNRHKLNINLATEEAYFDGHDPVNAVGDGAHPTTGNWRMFGMNGSYTKNVTNYTLYGFSVYSADDDTILYNLVPCTFDSTPGMYDTINRKFYGNSNPDGGNFTVSND